MDPNPIDLCTVDDVATWGNMPSALSTATSPDAAMRNVIQEAISGWSDYVMWRSGRDPGYFKGGNDFTEFTEVRDGTDSSSMGVLNGPVQSVSLVKINGQAIPPSTDWNVFGWFIEANPSFIGIRMGTGFLSGFLGFGGYGGGKFIGGKGNVVLIYKGGYKSVPPSLFEKTLKAVMVAVSRRLREDEGARTTPASGAVSSYRAYAWPPDCVQIVLNFTRTILTYGGGSY